ncbi:MAG: archaeosortase/exosortase family protein [Bacteroidota bacterium]
MAKKKNNKKKSSSPKSAAPKTPKAPRRNFFKSYWQDKSPVFKFIAGFVICILVFYALYYSSWFETNLKAPILSAQAVAGGALLNLFGYSVSVAGEVISGSGATVKIAGGCDGLEATALFLAAILVFPLPFKYKWPGLLSGLVVLSILNVLRIVGLYLTQKYWPEAFDFMHIQGGLYLYSIITILMMLIWADWALKNYKKEKEVLNMEGAV